jgi:hypothetical protein
MGSFTTRVSTYDSAGAGTSNVQQGMCFLPDTVATSAISATGSADVKWLIPSFYY